MTEPQLNPDYNVPPVSKTMTSFPDVQTLFAAHPHEFANYLLQIQAQLSILQQENWNLKTENLMVRNEFQSLKQSFQALEKHLQSVDKDIDYLKWDLHNENGNLKGKITELEMAQIYSD